MSLFVFDGWDHYNALADITERSGFLDYAFGGTATLAGWAASVFGLGRAAQLTADHNSTLLDMDFSSQKAEAFIGLRVQFGPESGARFFFIDRSDSSTKLTVFFNPRNHSIELWRGTTASGTLLTRSGNNAWSPMVSHFVEIKVIISAVASGVISVNLDGAPVVEILNANTQSGTNAQFNRLRLEVTTSAGSGTVTTYLDDFYYVDAIEDGIAPTSFLGDCRTCTLFATANSSVQWTPLSGTNYQMIDEVSMDSDSTYNSDGTVGHTDTFDFENLPSTIYGVIAVQATAAIRNDGTLNAAQLVGGVEGAAVTLTTSYKYFTDLRIANPADSDYWEPADVNSLTIGYRVKA